MRRTKLKVRILSWVLSLLMAFTAIPTYAAETVSGNDAVIENHAPELSADAPEMVELTVGDSYDVTQYFSDAEGDALTYNVDCDDVVLGTGLSSYEYVPTEAGRFLVSVEASDGQASTWWSVAMIVTEAVNKQDGSVTEDEEFIEDDYSLDPMSDETEPYVLDVSSHKKPHKWNYVSTISVVGVGVKEATCTAGDSMDVKIVLDSDTATNATFTIDLDTAGNKAADYPMDYNEESGFDAGGVKSVTLANGSAYFSFTTTGQYSSKRSEAMDWNVTISIDGVQAGLSITPDQVELKGAGATAALSALNASGDISWSSSDEDVVTVDNGVLTSVGLGTATITATSGEQSAECTVTVVEETELKVGDAVQMPSATWGYLDTITVKGFSNVLYYEQKDNTVNIVLPKDTLPDSSYNLLFTGAGASTNGFDVKYNDESYKNAPLPVQLSDGQASLTLRVIGGNSECDWTINIEVSEDNVIATSRTAIPTGAGHIEGQGDVWYETMNVVGPMVETHKVTEYQPENRKIVVLLNEETLSNAVGRLEFVKAGYELNELVCNVSNPYSYQLEDGKHTLILTTKGALAGVERTYKIILKNSNTTPAIIDGVQNVNTEWFAQQPYTVDFSKIFTDAENDELEYMVSVDGGTSTRIFESTYTYPADSEGSHTLVFTADDGLVNSAEYSVTLDVKNSDEKFVANFYVPTEITPSFYANAGFDAENGDVLGAELDFVKDTAENGLTKYMVAVPVNVNTVSFRGVDGTDTSWGGATVAVESGSNVTLRQAKGVITTLFEGEAPTAENAEFRVVDAKGNYAVSGGDFKEGEYLAYRFLLAADRDYNYQAVATGTLIERYGVRDSGTQSLSADSTEIEVYNLPIALKDYFHVTVPAGSTVMTGKLNYYYIYTFEDAFYQKENADGTVTFEVENLPYENEDGSVGGAQFVKVTHPDGVTYWDYESDGDITLTEAQLFIGENDGFNSDTIFHNFEEYKVDVADIYLSVNKEMYVDLDVDESYELNVFRNWFAVNNFANGAVALPDVHYQVIDANGNASNVVTVTPDEYNSSVATVTANVPGTAIVLVTYDAMYHAGALQGGLGNERPQPEKFSAIWPENTGVFVVSVGADGTAIQSNTNTDAEHNPIYYIGDAGAEFSFTPEVGATVSVARAAYDNNKLTYNGFSTSNITTDSTTGEVTVAGLTQGRHIIKIEKNGVADYQVVTTKQTTMTITDAEGNVITADTEVNAGTELTVQFGDLYNPANKLSGIYNTNCAVSYVGEDGSIYNGSSGSDMGFYLFASDPSLHKVTITVPDTWDEPTYTLEGSFKMGGFGSNAGAHRGILLYKTGKDVQKNADGITGNPGVLPTITIKVKEGTAIKPVPVTKVTLNRTAATAQAGTSILLEATVTPENTTEKNITWTSSNEAVATVADGVVYAISEGEATITVQAGSCSAQCTVNVTKADTSSERDDGNDEITTVYLSVSHDAEFLKSDKTDTVMAFKKLEVPYFDLSNYGLGNYAYEDGKVTALHLYLYALETCQYGLTPEEAGKGYLYKEKIFGTDMLEISGSAGSIFLEKFWGMDMNLNYYHNYQYPIAHGTVGATADQIILNDGDIITVGHFTDYGFYSDPTSVFNFLKVDNMKTEVSVSRDQEITVSVYRAGSNLGTASGTANDPVKMEIDVYYAKADSISSGVVTEWTKIGTTDSMGQLKVNTAMFDQGQYVLAVAGRKGSTYQNAICSAPGGILLNVLNGDDGEAFQNVQLLIDAIGDVTLDDELLIKEARAAYDALSEIQKLGVTNYSKLKAAEAAFALLGVTDADKTAAANVDSKIDAIGNVTLKSEDAIKAAREAYEALTDTQKLLVTKLSVLEKAEEKLDELKNPGVADASVMDIYKMTGNYMAALGTPYVGSIGGEWMALGLARSGRTVPSGYYDNVVAFVKENIDDNGRLHASKSTDNSRIILALTAAGYDPRNVGGHDLLDGLTDLDYLKKQGINGPIWALLALDSYNYSIPKTNTENPVTRSVLIDTILAAQLEDDGWALSGTAADADMTGMALQALSPYYDINSKVKTAVDAAITKLSSMQNSDGSYGSVDGKCAESCAQVIVALTALDINPDTDARFVKNGKSVVDALCTFAVSGGGFKHTVSGKLNGMATEQGYYALTAYMRLLNGNNTLYDMSDVTLKVGNAAGNAETEQAKKDKTAAEEVEDLIDAIGTVTVNSESKIKAARAAYDKLTAAQKKLVDNYGKLTAAEATFDVKKADYVEDLIDAIGTVTVNSESRIAKARVAYYNLTDAQKKLVDNYEYLLYAEDKLEEARVEYVEDLIDSIGTVTKNSKTKIDRARTAYNNLSDSNKEKVSNLNVLLEAEAAYAKLAKTSTTKKTNTKTTTSSANTAEADMEDLTKFAEKVKVQIESIDKDSLAGEMLDAILAYEELTEEEKAAIDMEWSIESFKERVAEALKTDSKTGIGVSGAEWNIQIVVDDVLDVTEIQYMQEKLGGNTMLGLWDIYLEDVLTGKEVQPDGSILVKIPLASLGDYTAYDGLTVVHYAEDGTVEYMNSTLIGDCIAFNATEFSYYVVAGYMGASPLDNLTDDVISDDLKTDSSAPVLPWVIGGGCGLALLAVLLFLIMKNKKVQAGD